MVERDNRRKDRNREESDGLISKTICINRVTKVVKGGRNMRFSALVVVGDGAGKVGLGMGKAREVQAAIEKASQLAKRNMFEIAMKDTTIPHHAIGKFGSRSGHPAPRRSRYRRHSGRSRACGTRSRGRQGHQDQVHRLQQPHQLRQGGDRGAPFPAQRRPDRETPRRRDRGLRRALWQQLRRKKKQR